MIGQKNTGRLMIGSIMTFEAWQYKDPEKVVMRLEAKRIRLKSEAAYCRYRIEPIFEGDAERCNQRKQGFDRCNFCELKRVKNG